MIVHNVQSKYYAFLRMMLNLSFILMSFLVQIFTEFSMLARRAVPVS